MKKYLYLFLLITFTVATGCSKKGDDIEPPVPPVELTEDALIGIWETYYYEKQISTGNSYFSGLRYIDYDGFRSEFKKEGGKYVARDYNLAGDLVFEADYYVTKDTIKYERQVKTEDGRDSLALSWQRVREFSPQKGIIQVDHSYSGVTEQDGVKYKITDIKMARNIATAPTTTEGVSPAKHIINYDDLCTGKWKIYLVKEYVDGEVDHAKTDETWNMLKNVSFKFYTDDQGNRKCLMQEFIPSENISAGKTIPVVVIDDVIHLLNKEVARDENNNIVYDENGNIVYEDAFFYMWVTSWKEREGLQSFIDFKESRYEENIKVIVKTHVYMQQITE